MKKQTLLASVFAVSCVFSTDVLAATISVAGKDYKTTECPDAAHTFKLPDPVPSYYHFYCTFSTATDADGKEKNDLVIMWNHATKIKGFVFEIPYVH